MPVSSSKVGSLAATEGSMGLGTTNYSIGLFMLDEKFYFQIDFLPTGCLEISSLR